MSRTLSSPSHELFDICVTNSPIRVLIVSVKMASVSLYMCHALYHLPLTNSLICVTNSPMCVLTVSVKMAGVSLCYLKICCSNVHVSIKLVYVTSYICVSLTLSSPSHELSYISVTNSPMCVLTVSVDEARVSLLLHGFQIFIQSDTLPPHSVFMCVIWLSYTRATWLIHAYVYEYWCICVFILVDMCDMTHIWCICVTWL